MNKIILLNHINSDGIGDFYHFLDIYKALTTLEKSRDFEFISVICCKDPLVIPRIENEFTKVNRGKFFIGVVTDFEYDPLKPLLQAEFNLAVQIIQVSYHVPFIFKSHYQIPESSVLKLIGEHECGGKNVEDIHPFGEFSNKCQIRSMGLSKKHFGIKIKKHFALVPKPRDELFEEINLTESELLFKHALLTYTSSVGIADFNRNNYLYPAYFNINLNLVRFLLLLSMHVSKQSQPKDIAIYLSGQNLQLKELRSFSFDIAQFSKLPIKKIMFIEANGQCSERVLNKNDKKIIRIFHGFYLEDELYQAIYKQAPMVGISGDNTFEQAISLGVLPFYCSTNAVMKNPTLLALAQIIRDKMNFLPLKIREDYFCYFNNFFWFINFYNTAKGTQLKFEQCREAFANLDLEEMMQYWPQVAAYLFEHHNFYSNLEEIVFPSTLSSQPKFNEVVTTVRPKLPKPTISPNKIPNIDMRVLSGFMLAVGATAVAIALTILHASSFGLLGLAVAGVGVAMFLGGIGLFKATCDCQISRQGDLQPKYPTSPQDLLIPRQDCVASRFN